MGLGWRQLQSEAIARRVPARGAAWIPSHDTTARITGVKKKRNPLSGQPTEAISYCGRFAMACRNPARPSRQHTPATQSSLRRQPAADPAAGQIHAAARTAGHPQRILPSVATAAAPDHTRAQSRYASSNPRRIACNTKTIIESVKKQNESVICSSVVGVEGAAKRSERRSRAARGEGVRKVSLINLHYSCTSTLTDAANQTRTIQAVLFLFQILGLPRGRPAESGRSVGALRTCCMPRVFGEQTEGTRCLRANSTNS